MHSLIVFGPNAMIYVEMRPGVTVARREMVKVIANQVETCKRHRRTYMYCSRLNFYNQRIMKSSRRRFINGI